jgi:Mrp family chromosome partitioning ATPase
MTSGRPVSNPTAVLLSWATREMMNQLLVEYDFVIIDAPALLVNVADARILSNLAEGVVMVIRTGMTSRAAVERARGGVTNLVGVIINDVDYQLLPSYYMSYYGREPDRPHSA